MDLIGHSNKIKHAQEKRPRETVRAVMQHPAIYLGSGSSVYHNLCPEPDHANAIGSLSVLHLVSNNPLQGPNLPIHRPTHRSQTIIPSTSAQTLPVPVLKDGLLHPSSSSEIPKLICHGPRRSPTPPPLPLRIALLHQILFELLPDLLLVRFI